MYDIVCFFYDKVNIRFFFSIPLSCCLLPQQIRWQSQMSCPYKQQSQEEREPSFPDWGIPLSPRFSPKQYPLLPPLPYLPGNNTESTWSLWEEVWRKGAASKPLSSDVLTSITNLPTQHEHSDSSQTLPTGSRVLGLNHLSLKSACAKPAEYLGINGIKFFQRISSSWERKAGENSRLQERRITDHTVGLCFKKTGMINNC